MTTQKLKFDCICNGCRNYPRRPAQIWHESQIKTVTNGFFFSDDTMRFFKSRVSDFKPIDTQNNKTASLMVIVSSKFGDDDPRHYEIVVVCPFGELWRESANNELVKYESLKKARTSALWTSSEPFGSCDCHGCQIERAGR